MFCENCGYERIGAAAFCEGCGKPFGTPESPVGNVARDIADEPERAEVSINRTEPVSEVPSTETAPSVERMGNITVNGTDMQWMYEFSFWRNPAVLITTAKVLLISLLVPALFMFFITLGDGFGEAIGITGMILGYGIVLLAGLLAIAYPLVGFINGGKYFVLFKMDDKGVNHMQLDRQFKKAQALGFLTALIGLSGGNLSAGGAGIMAATKQSLYTSFRKVKSVKAVRSRNTIYVNESMTRNQIYVENEDFDFVLDHILKRCPKNVRVTGSK
ncbi:hypothetical protein [Youngiibacter fragilis]|uniref:Uncharacterized protein n=1 Tax=Youngiibacter fragilis 232.1 TaxID=994573 RepID=V7IAZ0_9CLOT|nr:hypothetical protein [Youngiibacter fragilis]ETA82476.1 hypothetical protein T472_0200890 [Youngiibacter fragilis 232.1]